MSQGKSAAHTPRKWNALQDSDGDFAIYDQDSRLIAITDSDTAFDAENARLIAASPTMLEALELLHRLALQSPPSMNIQDDFEVMDKAWMAIKIARGESQ